MSAPHYVPRAEAQTWHLEADDRRFRQRHFSAVPNRFADAMAGVYVRMWGERGRAVANAYLRETVEAIGGGAVPIASGEGDLREAAQRYAGECVRVALRWHVEADVLRHMEAVALRAGIAPPEGGHVNDAGLFVGLTPRGRIARLSDALWWRRRLRVSVGRRVEAAAIFLGLVHRRAGIYASDETVARRRGQLRRNADMLARAVAENEDGQRYTLEELAALSVSNPVLRRGELMTRIAGFEAVAKSAGHLGLFVTVTAPSRYHARLSDGRENPRYGGGSPRDAQASLCAAWARARAAIKRAAIALYGFRVVEPHHDGTPHWHMLVFAPADQAAPAMGIMRRYFMAEDGDEAGADRARFRAVEIDWKRGSAAGYIAKYIAKSIRGLGGVADFADAEDGASGAENSERIDAWAACWGIRQCQQIGGPSVTVWRELRRLDYGGNGVIDHAAAAADVGNWRRYVEVMGGPVLDRLARPIRPWRVWSDEPGRYLDAKGDRVVGVESPGDRRETRAHRWVVKVLGGGAERRPWSTVNNCTEEVGNGHLSDRGVSRKCGPGDRGVSRKCGPGDYGGRKAGVGRYGGRGGGSEGAGRGIGGAHSAAECAGGAGHGGGHGRRPGACA